MQLIFAVFVWNAFVVSAKTINNQRVCEVNQIHEQSGDLNLALIVNECSNLSSISWTHINSALWVINRLNTMNFTSPLDLGLTVFKTCTEDDNFDVIYKIFRERDRHYFVDAYLNRPLQSNFNRFSNVLDVHVSMITTSRKWAMEATIKLLLALDVKDNITVYTEDELTLQEFYALTKTDFICIRNGDILTANAAAKSRDADTIILFAKSELLKRFLANFTQNDAQMVLVPSDDSITFDVPDGSYVIKPLLSERAPTKPRQSVPSPLFFDIANPILESIITSLEFAFEKCNGTVSKIQCLRDNHNDHLDGIVRVSPRRAINLLGLENSTDAFVYNVFRVESLTAPLINILQTFINVFTYSIFNSSLNGPELNASNLERTILCPQCRLHCVNFVPKPPPKTILISYAFSKFGLRTESWVFGFLAVSALGIIFCMAVFTFIVVRLCKKDILEGNPFLTIILLITVAVMYASVVPFALDSDKEVRNYICMARAMSTTLTYALAFSLLLSRSILLATISKEVGFMAHVPGPVQSFLTLFIFGVQGALSLQFINHCEDIFRGISFVYLMSYNVILLILLLFICPLNTRSQRNYKEGRYYTVGIVLIVCVWSCWMPAYAVFNVEWRDPMLCLGLVSTASILLGAIFIPRTYMMTVAATRDRLTSALPSLQVNSSIVDVYRASAQPIYDCINIAAINARCGPPSPPPLPRNEIYSCPTVPFEEDYDFDRSVTPNPDKVTRF